MTDIFNLTLPTLEYVGDSTSPIDIGIYSYAVGTLISNFSGSLISDIIDGDHIDDIIFIKKISDDYFSENLTLNDNSYLFPGMQDQVYETILYEYYAGIPIVFYSGSSVSDVTSLTLEELIIDYVG